MDDSVLLQICLAAISFLTLISNGIFAYLKYKADKKFEVLTADLKECKEDLTISETKVTELQTLVFQINFDKATVSAQLEEHKRQKENMSERIVALEAHEEDCTKELNRLRVLINTK